MQQQRGGTFLGFLFGVVIGLAGALVVAVYMTKVPLPFMNKTQSRSAEQDEAEAKKNKDWDPNAPLYGKSPVKPVKPEPAPDAAATPAAAPAAAASAPNAAANNSATPAPAAAASKPSAKAEDKKPASADPLGDLVKAKSAANSSAADSDAQPYFVQTGAYRSLEDAQSQRAKLSLSGIETKVYEREQSGGTVYRVRLGPFDKKEDAQRSKEKLDKAGVEASVVH